MRTLWTLLPVLLLPFALGCATPAPEGGASDEGAGVARQAIETDPRVEVFVVLADPPPIEGWTGWADGDATAVRRRQADVRAEHDRLRPELKSLGALVVGELDLLANAFHIEVAESQLSNVERLPGVLLVEPAPMFHLSLSRGLNAINAPQAWSPPLSLHGAGMTVGIIDTGIDYYHAAFGGSGDPADFTADDSTVIEAGTFPTGRVVGGYDFVGNGYNPELGPQTIAPDPDPVDCEGHGTHVASIAAGSAVNPDGSVFTGTYDQSLDLAGFRVGPGVAPEADIYALKVFGCARGTSVVSEALEWAADPNDDANPDDRLDVVNLSLGSAYGGETGSFLYGQVIRNLTNVGTVVVAAGGNDNGTFFSVGSPSTHPDALSVAASTDSGFVILQVDAPANLAGPVAAVEGGITAPIAGGGVTAEVVRTSPSNACSALQNPGELAGKIALIDRGTCTFLSKLEAVEAAGAIGAVMVQNSNDPPFAMGGDDEVGIPGVMIGRSDGQAFTPALGNGLTVTLTGQPFPGEERVAGLSSRGPSLDAWATKPEVSAPGVNVAAADVGSGDAATLKSGTSMASPFVAGAAALVREAQPNLDARQIKAVLMNHADPIITSAGVYPVSLQGTGRLDVARAVEASATMVDTEAQGLFGISFGAHVIDETFNATRTVEVRNHGTEERTFNVSATPTRALPGVTISVSPSSVVVPPSGTAQVTIGLEVDPAAFGAPSLDPFTTPAYDFGDGNTNPRHALVEIDGFLLLDDGDALRLPYYGVVRAASERRAVAASGCGEQVTFTFEGDSLHPEPAATAFELGLIDPVSPGLVGNEAQYDLRAIGAATDAATAESFEDTSLFFGVAVEGTWTTPTTGPRSKVGVFIDADLDQTADYAIVAEPLGADPPYLDVLAATTYDLSQCESPTFISTCQQGERKRYLNMVPSDVADTMPFINGVVVLATFADQVGLSPSQSRFAYQAFTRSIFGEEERSDWVEYDFANPRLDPAADAPEPGRPVFVGDQAINVRRGVGAAGAQLLVFHHSNLADQRWEALDVNAAGGLVVTVDASVASSDAEAPFRIEVANEGSTDVSDITVTLTPQGADLLAASGGGATCDATTCTIPALTPGQRVAIDATLSVPDGAAEVKLTADASSADGCRVSAESFADRPEAPSSVTAISVGCGCTVVGQTNQRDRNMGALLFGALLVVVARRRRQP